MRYLLLLLPMAACAASVPESDTCGATGFHSLIGQSEAVFATMTFPDTTRFISPNAAVTMDFNPERLNFHIDGSGVIVDVRCG